MPLTERQKQITSAALQLIAKQGIQCLTIRNLADAVGVTEAAVYRHFPGKNAIVRALILSFEEAVRWRKGLRGWEAIRMFAMSRIELVLQNPSLAHVFFSEEIFQDDEAFRRILQEMLQKHKQSLIERCMEAREDGKLRKDVALDSLPCMIYGPIRLLIKQWGLSHHAFDLKARSCQLLDMLELVLRPAERA